MFKAIIFDLDHTLFDRHATLRSIAPMFREYFDMADSVTDEKIAELWIYADDHYVYDGWEYIYRYLVEHGVFKTVPKYEDYRSFIYDTFSRVAVKYDYVLPMLKKFKKQGLKVGLITNGRHELQYKKLKMTGLMYIFDEIIVSGDVGTEKPDREIFDMMCEKLGVKSDECLYVGDNQKNDIGGAKNAGMHTCLVHSTCNYNPRAPKAEYEVANVGEVENIITIGN